MEILTDKSQASDWVVRGEIERRLEIARALSSQWHKEIEVYEQEYFHEITGDIRDSKDKVYLTELADAADLGMAILLNAGFEIELDRPGDMYVDKAKAGAIEEYLHRALSAVEHRTGDSIISHFAENTMRLGAGILHWAFNPDPFQGIEAYDAPLHLPPVDIWVIHPRNFFPVLGGPRGQFQYVVFSEERTVADAINLAVGPLGDDDWAIRQMRQYYSHLRGTDIFEQKDELHDYWGWHQVNGRWVIVNAVMFGNAVLRPFTVMPGYRVFPWSLASARNTRSPHYHKRWLPFFWHARQHVHRAERQLGQMEVILEKIADIPFVIETTHENPTPIKVFGDNRYVVPLPPGHRFTPPQYATIPRDMWPMLDKSEQKIQKALLPDSMYGLGRPLSDSGYGLEQQSEGGKLKLIEPRRSMATALAHCFRGILNLVSAHTPQQVVYATYVPSPGFNSRPQQVVLFGADLDERTWEVKVKWRDELPNDKARRMALAGQAKSMELLSDETIMREFLGIENPIREIEARLLQKVLTSDPRIAEARAFQVMMETGAFPDFTLEQQAKARVLAEQEFNKALAFGMSPQQAYAWAEQARQGALFAMMQANPMMQAMRMAQQGSPNFRTQMMARTTPRPTAPPGQDIGQPVTGQAGMPGPQFLRGGPPPGSPDDPGAQLRQMANALNGTRGKRQ